MTILEYLLSDEDPDTLGVSALSLVFNPAHKSQAVMMSESTDTLFKVTNEAERIVKGVFVKAGKPVKEKNSGGALSIFTAPTIRKMRDRFHKSGADKRITINHEKDDGIPVYQDGCYVIGSHIVENKHDVESLKAQGITDANVGDWIVEVKTSEDVWKNDVMAGQIKGLSLEGNFNDRAVTMSSYDEQCAKAEQLMRDLFN